MKQTNANKPLFIQMNPEDNVGISIEDISKGTPLTESITALSDIPQGHKVAVLPIGKEQKIKRYGVVLGYALEDIPAGEWINENSLRLPTPPDIHNMPYATNINTDLPKPTRTTFEGYPNPTGGYAGTRNILAIHTTVQCVTGVLNVAVARIRQELLPKHPNVDDVLPINHAYGCGVAIDAPEAKVPIRVLQNIMENPNFGGEIMVVGLGCEKLTPERLMKAEDLTPENLIILQDFEGMEAMITAIMDMAEVKLARLNQRKRETLPLSKLLVGMQCGGSDAFSGVTANPAAGYASDMLVSAGATVMFSEVTEVRDGVHFLAARTVNEEVRDDLVREMVWYDNYLELGGVDRSANPTPGNKQGGLSNIVEKAMGSIAKSGTSPIVEVLSPGERPTKQGLIYAATPASDIVCGPLQVASGATVQVFMTGRGTPYGLAALPVIKVASRTTLANRWHDLIDLNAGTIATGDATIPEVGQQLFEQIVAVASGEETVWAEKYNLHNDMIVFNPAPIT